MVSGSEGVCGREGRKVVIQTKVMMVLSTIMTGVVIRLDGSDDERMNEGGEVMNGEGGERTSGEGGEGW